VANTPIKFQAPPGRTVTVDFSTADDTSIDTDVSATEETNGGGWYVAILDETNTGVVLLTVKVGGVEKGSWAVYVSADDTTQRIAGEPGLVQVYQWLDTAVTVNATTSKPEVDVAGISGSATAADNVEAVFTGTGDVADVDFTVRRLVVNNDTAADSVYFYNSSTGIAFHVNNNGSLPATYFSNDGAGAGFASYSNGSSNHIIYGTTELIAAINATVDTALTDIHLDHLLAVDYDPDSQPGTSTALLNELVESDGGVSRFTANALEQGPSGSLTAAAIADAVWDELADEHTTDGTFGKAFGGATNVYVAGLSGTLNTLDALDTAQDSQHATTQAAIGTAQSDLDTITGSDGVTLATAQGNYAPSTHSATDVWAAGTRTLTANTNLNDPTAAAIADAVLDEALSGHATAGTMGKAISDTLADTNELQTNQGAWATATVVDLNADQSGVTIGTVTTNSDMRGTDNAATATALATVATNVSTLLGRIPAALFAGITSLAEWLGLLAGKQTGDTTARTELRATGAGSGTFDETADSLEALRDRGDAEWLTATGFSTLDAAGVRTAVGLASANLDTQLADIPTVSEFEARTIVSASYATSSALATVDSNVDSVLEDTGTTLPATLAAIAGYVDTEVAAIKAVTDALPDAGALTSLATAAALTTVDTVVDGIQTDLSNATDGLGALKALIDAVQSAVDGQNDVSAADVWAAATRTLTANTNLNDPTAAAIAAAILAAGDVDGYSVEETLKLCLAALAGKLSGASGTTITIRAADDSTDRIVATVDSDGNRSAVVLTETG